MCPPVASAQLREAHLVAPGAHCVGVVDGNDLDLVHPEQAEIIEPLHVARDVGSGAHSREGTRDSNYDHFAALEWDAAIR